MAERYFHLSAYLPSTPPTRAPVAATPTNTTAAALVVSPATAAATPIVSTVPNGFLIRWQGVPSAEATRAIFVRRKTPNGRNPAQPA